MPQTDETEGLDLGELLYQCWKSVKRFWWIMLGCIAIFAVLVPTVCQWTTVPEYKATCSFTVRVVSSSVTESIHNQYDIYYDKDLAEQLDKTFTYILTSDHLGDEVRQELDKELVAGRITAKCIEGSNLFEITALSKSPQEAYELLVTVMEVFPNAARYVVGDLIVEMLEEPIANPTPANAVNLKQMAALGGFLGFALAAGILFLIALSVRTVRKPEELEAVLNMPCLGIVPITRERTNNIAEGEFRESIRGISRKVETALEQDGVKVLLVTGTQAEEGKSLIARYLAQTLAEWGKRVYLVDCDLRKPSLHKQFKCRDRKLLLEDYLNGKEPLDAALCQTNIKGLTLVGSSEAVREPTVLLDTQAMKDMIAQLASSSDCVILDTPPCDDFSDVAALQSCAQRILYVVRQNYAAKERIVNAVEHLTDNESKLLGFVLNYAEKTASGYGKYGYGAYSYGKYGNGYYGKYGHYNKYQKYYHTEESSGPSEK